MKVSRNSILCRAVPPIPLPPAKLVAVIALAALCILLVGSGAVDAATPPNIRVDGQDISTLTSPRIIDDMTFVPLSDMVALTGGRFYLDPRTGVCRVISPISRFMLVASRPQVFGNSALEGPIPAPVMEDDEMLVWVRFVADAFNWNIDWDAQSRSVLLGTNGSVDPDVVNALSAEISAMQRPARVYEPTGQEMDLFLRLISAEAWGEGPMGKLGVAAVVINSILSPYFPDTMYDVIMQPGRFSPVSDGSINHHILDRAREAAERALMGEDPTMGALYFYNPRIASPAGRAFHETLRFTVEIGNHRFSTRP